MNIDKLNEVIFREEEERMAKSSKKRKKKGSKPKELNVKDIDQEGSPMMYFSSGEEVEDHSGGREQEMNAGQESDA